MADNPQQQERLEARMKKLGYTFCGSHVMMGGYEFKDVFVKYDKSGVVASLEAIIPRSDLEKLISQYIDSLLEQARFDEVTNAKVVHIDMHHGDRGEFDRWCTKRQEDIKDGRPAEYGYDNSKVN